MIKESSKTYFYVFARWDLVEERLAALVLRLYLEKNEKLSSGSNCLFWVELEELFFHKTFQDI